MMIVLIKYPGGVFWSFYFRYFWANCEQNFIEKKNGFYINNFYYADTDTLYIEKNLRDVLDKRFSRRSIMPRKN